MDRAKADAILSGGQGRPLPRDPDRFPSRRLGRARVRDAVRSGLGLVVLTGEPGVGKTTLWRGLEAEPIAGERWIAVDASPRTSPSDLYRLLGRAIGVDRDGFGRTEWLDLLAERSIDGERWAVVIDEAQNLDHDALEEVRVLSGRIVEGSGLGAILLVGQTSLCRRLAGPQGAGLAARLAAHIHLRPLDADEVSDLIREVAPDAPASVELADRIHVASGGLPARVAEIARRLAPRPSGPPAPVVPSPAPRIAPALPERSTAWDEPLVGPSKPPIRVEEGLIEVGWQPEDATGTTTEADDRDFERSPTLSGTESDERIDDHYAALQAWQEWATNQGRHPLAMMAPADAPRDADEASSVPPDVRADDEHGFAPFGRLFTRARQENDAD